MTKITRRDFIKLIGLSSAAAGLTGCVGQPASNVLTQSGNQSATSLAQDEWVATVCDLCPAGCGILVRVVNGRAVKIEGNPLNPNNQGRICPRGLAGLQVLYNPDRLKGPLRRAGERGAGEWERVSWDEALEAISERLRKLRDASRPHELIFMNGAKPGIMRDLIVRFCHAFGTPNVVELPCSLSGSAPLVHYLMQGWRTCAGYDWENTDYVLSFSGSLLDARQPSVKMLQTYSHLRRGRPDYRSKIVQVESRFSITAAKADEWIPIEPGTEGALALGIARVIVEEGLYNRSFIENHAFGFRDWTDEDGTEHMGFRSLVLKSYSPRAVSAVTGVSVETIQRIAREFSTNGPSLAIGDVSWQTNGVFSHMAIQALNALVGSIDTPGGVIRQKDPPLAPWPEVALDASAQKGLTIPRLDQAGTQKHPLATGVYQALPEGIIAGDPYPAEAIFLYQADPLFSSPEPKRFYEAFQKVPFIVSFSSFMDDSTSYADLVLPDHTNLERWTSDVLAPSLGYPVMGLGRPVVQPQHETRDTSNVFLELARDVGGGVSESFPWPNIEGVLRFKLGGIFDSGGGSIAVDSFDQFWDEFQRRGVWSAPPYHLGEWERVLTTPSGKFEFYSQHLRRDLGVVAEEAAAKKGTTAQEEMESMLQGLGIKARGDELYMPHYEFPRWAGEENEYPLHLNAYLLMTLFDGRIANAPWLQQIAGLHLKEAWGSWVEINPETADKLGIADGDLVWVESPVGRVQVHARHYPGAMPHVVNIALGQGHRAYGRWAMNRGVNAEEIIANESDRLGGTVAQCATRVAVYKA